MRVTSANVIGSPPPEGYEVGTGRLQGVSVGYVKKCKLLLFLSFSPRLKAGLSKTPQSASLHTMSYQFVAPEMQVVGEVLIPPAKATLCWEVHGPGIRRFRGFQPQFLLQQNGTSHLHLTGGCTKLAASSHFP